MPASPITSGSYRSLPNDIYRPTTLSGVATNQSSGSFFDGFKRVFRIGSTGATAERPEQLLEDKIEDAGRQAVISNRYSMEGCFCDIVWNSVVFLRKIHLN